MDPERSPLSRRPGSLTPTPPPVSLGTPSHEIVYRNSHVQCRRGTHETHVVDGSRTKQRPMPSLATGQPWIAAWRRSWTDHTCARCVPSPPSSANQRPITQSVTQQLQLIDALRRHEVLWEALKRIPQLRLYDWYLGAGCIAQTWWNQAHGRPPSQGILDYDLVYFDDDLSKESEDRVLHETEELLADLNLTLDVKNQARVHLWYPDKFGVDITPYYSTRDAIDTWPTTSNAIGVRVDNGVPEVYAPFGLDDLMDLIIRPNRSIVTREVYESKARRWKAEWPKLEVIPWD